MAKILNSTEKENCFVIMPITDPDGYDKGHFQKVYEDIFKIAIDKSGFNPIRADEVLQTNFIHLDILQKLIDSPIAVCDLSSRNPNVLFELGLRQAFDKPTVLVQECGTQKIFDIAPLRMTDYRKELNYREVLEDQISISEAIKATKIATDKGDGINSLINLLSLSSPATLKDITDKDSTRMFQIMMAEINELRVDFRQSIKRIERPESYEDKFIIKQKSDSYDYERLEVYYRDFMDIISKNPPNEVVADFYEKISYEINKIIEFGNSQRQRIMAKDIKIRVEEIFNKWKYNNDNK
jgi:hypothetical protein